MRDRFLAVLVSLAVFAMGLLAGLWVERHRPFPPPPGAFMGEFGARPGPPGSHGHPTAPPVNRAQLVAEIDKLRPEMESFTEHITEIYAQFDRDLEPILTPEQRDKYEKDFKAHRMGSPGMGDESKPLSDEQIDQLMQRPLRTLTYFIIVPMTLERMATDLKLDETQREKVKDLLRVRREKFIELVDSAPPPSLMLSRLAPFAQRLAAPAGTPPPAPPQ